MKGVSPLIAVIVLIMLTLVVAGVLASWASNFAQTQRQQFQQCINARFIIRGGTYNTTTHTLMLVVYNWGQIPLTLDALIDYTNGTSEIYPDPIMVEANKIKNAVLTLPENIDGVTLTSRECPGVQDFLQRVNIRGL